MTWFISNAHCYYCFAEAETVDWFNECNKLGKEILSLRVGKRQAGRVIAGLFPGVWRANSCAN
jgi:hypothetical protein